VTSTEHQREIPAPGQAPLPAPNAAALLRHNALDHTISSRPAVRFEDKLWTHGEYVANCRRWANLFLAHRPEGPFHVGVLLDNTPEYLFAFGGAALAGATVVGLNHTRRGDNLLRDITHTDVSFMITEPRYEELLDPIRDRLPGDVLIVGSSLEDALVSVGDDDPLLEPDVDTPWALIFTSGTSDAPKAVICTQRRIMVTGVRMSITMDLTPDDVGYVAMPLFPPTR
jgi:fatty-acyl-CoA synthase